MTGEVSPADHGGLPAASGELRASHEDRDGVVEQLRVAAGDGRLTADELDERLELALTARTYQELALLTADLPAAAGSGALAGPGGAVPGPREVTRIQCRSGNASRNGRWVVPQRIEADIHSGNLRLVTRPGIVVDTEDVEIRHGNIRARAHGDPGVPEILRIEVSGKVRSGNIIARPARRALWQWLRRAPRPA